MSDLDKINAIFNAKIDSIKSKDELQNLKTEFFGKNLMNRIIEETKDIAKVESQPKFEGRQMVMIIQPI